MDPEAEQASGFPLAFRLYILGLVCASLFFVPAGITAARGRLGETLVWIVFISAANFLKIPMLPRMNVEASLGGTVIIAAAVVLPTELALFVALIALVNERELRGKTSPWLIVFNHAQEALSAGAAGLAAHLALSDPPTIIALIGATFLAVVGYNLLNSLAVTAGLVAWGRLGLVKAARETTVPYPRFAVDFGVVTLLAILIVVAYQQVGELAVLLLALPMWLGYSALRSARESEDRAEELAVRVRELETLNALGGELLTARRAEHVAVIVDSGLATALDTTDVGVSLGGDVRPHRQVVKIRGAEPAAIGVPADISERSMAVVEAIAGLASMALQRLELERELAENEKALSRLSGRILEEGTHERSRIALEIHDDVLPFLAAAQIQADNVRTALARQDTDRADHISGIMRDAVHDGIARLRKVIEALRRQILVPGGLRSGLVEALSDLRLQHGVEGRLHAPDPLPPLPLAVEILVLDTVRGCLTNVGRHARADSVVVLVDVVESYLRVDVRDDGVGFNPAAVGPGHHGLALMAQRVELARGRFDVRSAPQSGTTVHVEVPV